MGKVPIEFAYRSKENTLGGSFMTRGGMFSHDTKGEAEFLEFGNQVRVRFEFQVLETSGNSDQRRMVTVRGEAVSQRGDVL